MFNLIEHSLLQQMTSNLVPPISQEQLALLEVMKLPAAWSKTHQAPHLNNLSACRELFISGPMDSQLMMESFTDRMTLVMQKF